MTNSKKAGQISQQELCIDLPGEAVQCWRSADSLKVILRKHRDVIFDLKLGKGNMYTVEATDSDFYNARDKKIVFARRREIVEFADGERMHLWVTRNFKGALLLKSGGQLIMRVEPNGIDRTKYSESAKTKPAPLIFSINSDHTEAPELPSKKFSRNSSSVSLQRPVAAQVDEQCNIVCIVDGSLKNAPAKMLEYFEKGGGETSLFEFDPFDIATRNWLWGQAIGSAAYIRENWQWLRESIDSRTSRGLKLVTAKIHRVRGGIRFYFSGYSKFNTVFGPGGFGPGNERIMTIFSGIGKTSSVFSAMAKNIAGSMKGNALVAFIFGSATALVEWRVDAHKDGFDLASSLLMSLLKALFIAWLTGVVVAVIGFLVLGAAKLGTSVLLIGAFTVVVGIGISYLIDILEKKLGKYLSDPSSSVESLSDILAPYMRDATKQAVSSWEYLMEKFSSDYKELTFEKP